MSDATLVKDKNGIYVSREGFGAISYPDAGNDECFDIEKDSFWFTHRNEVIKKLLARYPHEGNFADIGGGNGYQADFIQRNFKDKEVFLIEPGYAGCLNATKYGVANVYNIPFQQFDFEGHQIGGIGLFDVVEHIENDVEFLREIAAACRPGTFIYMTVPAYKLLWSDADDYAGHYKRYNTPAIKSLAKTAGLGLAYSGYFMSYLPVPILLARSLPYRIRAKRDVKIIAQDATGNHKSGTVSRMILKVFNATEIGLLVTVGRIPFGSSCLAIFRTGNR